MALLDLLGRRWALRVLWELRDGPLQFRPLQQRCDGMSSSVLNDRLGELRSAGIIARGPGGYGLSADGAELLVGLEPLQAFAERWADRDRQISSIRVTGPSPTSSTAIVAPNTPRRAPARSQKRS